jgi:putative sigma-54 modulation protein
MNLFYEELAMSLNLTGKNFQITPAIKALVEEKFQKLTARYMQVSNIHVVLHIDHADHIAEGALHFHSHEIIATATANDMYVAIDELVEKMAHQMQKQKEKMIDSHHQS